MAAIKAALALRQIAESSDSELVARLAELRRKQRLEPLVRWDNEKFDEMQGIKREIFERANRAVTVEQERTAA